MQEEKIRMEGFADYESQLWNLIADARLLLTPNYCWRPRLRDPKAWSDQKAEKIFLQVGFVCWHVQVVVKLDFSFKAFFPFTSRVVSKFNVMLHDQKAEKKYFCKLGLFVDMFSPSGSETWFFMQSFCSWHLELV